MEKGSQKITEGINVPLGTFDAQYDIENTSVWSLGGQRIFLRKGRYLASHPKVSISIQRMTLFVVKKSGFKLKSSNFSLNPRKTYSIIFVGFKLKSSDLSLNPIIFCECMNSSNKQAIHT